MLISITYFHNASVVGDELLRWHARLNKYSFYVWLLLKKKNLVKQLLGFFFFGGGGQPRFVYRM